MIFREFSKWTPSFLEELICGRDKSENYAQYNFTMALTYKVLIKSLINFHSFIYFTKFLYHCIIYVCWITFFNNIYEGYKYKETISQQVPYILSPWRSLKFPYLVYLHCIHKYIIIANAFNYEQNKWNSIFKNSKN